MAQRRLDSVVATMRADVTGNLIAIRQSARSSATRDMLETWGWSPNVSLGGAIQDSQLAHRYAGNLGDLVHNVAGHTGAIATIDNRLATLAITENSQAFNSQRRALANELADKHDLLEIWDAQLDKATCDECWSLDGTEAIIGEGFPGGLEPGHVHARCRCTSHFIRRTYH